MRRDILFIVHNGCLFVGLFLLCCENIRTSRQDPRVKNVYRIRMLPSLGLEVEALLWHCNPTACGMQSANHFCELRIIVTKFLPVKLQCEKMAVLCHNR